MTTSRRVDLAAYLAQHPAPDEKHGGAAAGKTSPKAPKTSTGKRAAGEPTTGARRARTATPSVTRGSTTTSTTAATKRPRKTSPRKASSSVEPTPPVPYTEMETKTVRLTSEQVDWATGVFTRLNRARRGEGYRVTFNTVVRVAVTVLAEFEGDLAGRSEAEITEAALSAVRALREPSPDAP